MQLSLPPFVPPERVDSGFAEGLGQTSGCSAALRFATVGIMLLGAAAVVGQLFELGLCMIALGVYVFLASRLLQRDRFLESFLLMGFLGGYILSWCFGFLGYRYLLPWRGWGDYVPCEHPVLTAGLVLAGVTAASAGGGLASFLLGPVSEKARLRTFEFRAVLPHLLVYGALLLLYRIVWVSIMGFNARWEIGNEHATGSSDYWVAGCRTFFLPFYVLLGISMQPRLGCLWNWMAGLILAGCVGFEALTGGREFALEPVILCALGSLFSTVSWTALRKVWLVTLPLGIALFIVIGAARGSAGFSSGSIRDKVTETGMVLREGQEVTSPWDDPLFGLFSRVFESSGQIVIDHVYENQAFCGWMDFERLPFVLVPSFIYPQKLALEDGFERLIAFHGFQYSQFSSAPLTFLADSYERFGIPGVLGFHMAAGMFLVLLARLVLKLDRNLFVVVLLVWFAKSAIRLYPRSVLGFVNDTCYLFCRDALVMAGFFLLSGLVAIAFFPRHEPSEMPEIAP